MARTNSMVYGVEASKAYNDAYHQRLCDMAEKHKHEISDRVYNKLVVKQIAA